MGTVAFIPVRGGSKSIPGKNIRPIAGRPLVHWTTLAALDCPAIERVYVASDSAEIRRVAAQIDAPRLSVIDRSPETATDTASSESALLEFAHAHDFDRVVFIQATSPLLTGADLSGGLAKLERCGADSLLSVTREWRFRWQAEGEGGAVRPLNYDPQTRPRRQDWDGELVENGAFYVSSRDALLASNCRLSGRIAAWEMGPETALELDEPEDFQRLEALLLARGGGDVEARARCVKLLVSDVDGVLTDAGMVYGAEGEVLKKFSTRDGMGIGRWHDAGFPFALITGEASPIVQRRADKLRIRHVSLGIKDKVAELGRLLAELDLREDEVAYIGDDINDLAVMRRVGLAACPADAEPVVRAVAHVRCERPGGRGCVREFIDRILRAQGHI